MFSLRWWTREITGLLGKVYPLDSRQEEIIEYGLSVLLASLNGFALIMAMAALLGLFFPTFIVLLAAGSLRVSAGGAHCSAPWRCNLLGVLVFPFLGYIVMLLSACQVATIWLYVILAVAVAVGAVLGHAPVLTPNKPLSLRRRQKLRLRSQITVAGISVLIFFLLSRGLTREAVGMATGLLWQGFTLLPMGWCVIGSIDHFFSRWDSFRRREG